MLYYIKRCISVSYRKVRYYIKRCFASNDSNDAISSLSRWAGDDGGLFTKRGRFASQQLDNAEDLWPLPDDNLEELNDSSSEEIGQTSFRSDDLKQIKDQVRARVPKLKIIPIVGMGGIGKTFLAKSIYTDTQISCHFHVHAWITVSHEYKLRNVLLGLLRSFTSVPHGVSETKLTDEQQLAEVLYRNLKEKRYLIVLDDMWNTNTWNDLKSIFPDDNTGSRIILTTRLMEVATYANPYSPPHSMNCLSSEESWKLLHNEVFVGKSCPPDLMEIGKKIAKKCQGLPLAIVVVAGQLSKTEKNKKCWIDVVKRLDLPTSRNQEQVLDILCLSYNYLPQHLKSCFLYMATFPKSFEIPILKLFRLWSAEGLLQKEWAETPEHTAEKCFDDLVSRNLVMVTPDRYGGTANKTCVIHDLLWDLSFREAKKAGIYVYRPKYFRATTDTMFTGTYTEFQSSFAAGCAPTSAFLRKLRVLDLHAQFLYDFPEEITELVNLRYFELACCSNVPESVAKLRNLETLINNHREAGPILPKEIWLLSRLRHLHVGICTYLPCVFGATADGGGVSTLPDLQTLSTISFASCTEQVFSSIPNLKQLKIHEMGEEDEQLFDCLTNLSCLHQLENLNLYFSKKMRMQPQNLCPDAFPPSIKKLTLRGSHLPWEGMNVLAMLPNLEVLKLKKNAFKGTLYEQTLEGFPRLKVLMLEDLDIEHWIADTDHFPVLKRLVLKFCLFLKEIPCCFGEITTLESIELCGCSSSAEESAETIQQEQHSVGNSFHVRITEQNKKEKRENRMALTSKSNVHHRLRRNRWRM